RTHARVLEIDDAEVVLAQHQIAAVVVAMAEHSGLGGQLLGDGCELGAKRLALHLAERDAAIRLEKVVQKKIELPRELFNIESNTVRKVSRMFELGASSLQHFDEANRLPI